jgi:hypothetical protein
MRTAAVVILGVIASAGSARGADAPLLVSVEVAPGADVSPGEVRHLIATELGMPVVSARDAAAAGAADVLLVTVAPHELRMSLRAGAAPVVSRAIAAPADRPARLRSIGWLAGNLARDQVGPLVAAPAAPPSAPLPPDAARPLREPPPLADPPPASDSGSPAVVVSSRPSIKGDSVPHARWSITALGGPVLNVFHYNDGTSLGRTDFSRATAYRIEMQHQATSDSLLFGAALEAGPNAPAKHYFGAVAFAGSRWRWRSWFVEANLGLGLEVIDEMVKKVSVTNSSDMLGPVEQTTVSSEPVPELYVRVAGAAGVNLTQSFDLVAQLGAHLSSGQFGPYYFGFYLSSIIGLRLRLP